jgi:hypothetical protein
MLAVLFVPRNPNLFLISIFLYPYVTLELKSSLLFSSSFFTWFGDTELKSLADGVQDEVKTHATCLDNDICY